jgi:hypothetical protein
MPTASAVRRRLATATAVTAALGAAAAGTLAGPAASAAAAGTGFAPQLTRAPYLTDLTTTSVRINWGTSTQSRGTIHYGPAGDCAAHTATATDSGYPITVNGLREYRTSLAISGLSPDTAYCYRVSTGGSAPVDLLGTHSTPSFSTLQPADGTAPLTFGVFGDWGWTGNAAGQSALDAQIASSGARFILSAGDTAYPDGSQTNYGDLQQTGDNVSAVFGPSYWAEPGLRVPAFTASGNHGRNSTYLLNWPQASTVAGSNGYYAMTDYGSVDGSAPGSYPTGYYAFSTGGVRIYLLDAAWGDTNTGTATGGPCGSHCAAYQVDRDAHWVPGAAEYEWLKADLAAHPGGLKMAVFHYPLRSDDSTEPNDAYLNSSAGSGSLESLLKSGGVDLAFNGHAHIYQRNTAPSDGIVSYVTGGGGGRATTVSHCSATDAYAVGWSYASDHGLACGAAPHPTSPEQVLHYLKVSVSGSDVTVSPTDSTGRVFDEQTYHF